MERVMRAKRNSAAATTSDSVNGVMIRLAVRELAKREGIDNPNSLAVATGLPYETCRRVWEGQPSMIGLNTLEKLCDALRVRPGQLFDYEHEPNKPKRKRKAQK
jgi:DNA-binding Xre family transcriptional regulator